MNIEAVLISVIVLLVGALIAIMIKISGNKSNTWANDSMKLIQEQMFNLNKTLDSKMGETNRFLDEKLSATHKTLEQKLEKSSEILDAKLGESSKILSDNMNRTFATSTKINEASNKRIEDITRKLTELWETNKQIQDIGSQLRGLENVLRNPKQRWNLGEYFLNELLDNVFTPEQYATQYTIEWIGIVDAVLFIWDKIIPIDSKFPQENYQRLVSTDNEMEMAVHGKELKKDITKRIDETSKYIAPDQNTTDFAFMLIPAEGMYYDIFINKVADINAKSLIEYAFKQKVIICSPSGFYAYLQTVIQGMRSLQIEEQAKEIQKYVVKLQEDLERFQDRYNSLGKSLGTAVKHYDNASTSFKKIDKDILKITHGEAWGNLETLPLEAPDLT